MPKFAFAVPVLPGRKASEVTDLLRSRFGEYEESRRRLGITMERVYQQETPMGTMVIAYVESERSFEETMADSAASQAPIDRDFNAKTAEVHGFDTSQPPQGPPPEVIGDWVDPDVKERRTGLAFVAPLIPGRTDAGRAIAHEAFVGRRQELTESRRALSQNVETVIVNSTPMGDVTCVYIEGVDPVEGNRRFAASQRPYDVWFKEQLTTIFPPEVDFSQPLPPIQQLWDWHRATVSA